MKCPERAFAGGLQPPEVEAAVDVEDFAGGVGQEVFGHDRERKGLT